MEKTEDENEMKMVLAPTENDFSPNAYIITIVQHPVLSDVIAQYSTIKVKIYMGTCQSNLQHLHVIAG